MGIFWGRGEVHTGFGGEIPYTLYFIHVIKSGIIFNGQACEYFGAGEQYIQDFGGEILHSIHVFQMIKSGIILIERHWAILD